MHYFKSMQSSFQSSWSCYVLAPFPTAHRTQAKNLDHAVALDPKDFCHARQRGCSSATKPGASRFGNIATFHLVCFSGLLGNPSHRRAHKLIITIPETNTKQCLRFSQLFVFLLNRINTRKPPIFNFQGFGKHLAKFGP
jgi:hypothetical protein